MKKTVETGLEIAVIGMACRFPGAINVDKFWENIKNGVESVTFFSEEELLKEGIDEELIKNPDYVKAKPCIEELEFFDSDFFGYTHREASLLDIQSRLFHEIAYHALEHSGYNPDSYNGMIGVYAGASTCIEWFSYLLSLDKKSSSDIFESSFLANKDMLSQTISYKLNLKGPSYTTYTTCSTALSNIHLACRGLLLGECCMALAGGVSISLPEKSGYLYEQGMILSKDGHCRAFDENANGTIFGDGAGAVVLKRLNDAIADNDTIYAVIKASVCNNDGRSKVGFSAPSAEGQVNAIKSVYELSQISPESVTYLEAHATGTNIGDPIEFAALTKAFNTSKKQYCSLGSVKANIGHLHAAAGIASFIKTVMAIYNKQLPPQINCETVNKKINLAESPFYINNQLKEWNNQHEPLRAGISSFGIGGTNVHLLLEEYLSDNQSSTAYSTNTSLIVLSAKTEEALAYQVKNITNYLSTQVTSNYFNLQDIAYTLQVGRKEMNYRAAFIVEKESIGELNLSLESLHYKSETQVAKKNLALVFQNKWEINSIYQYFMQEQVFKEIIKTCMEYIKNSHGIDLIIILDNEEPTSHCSQTQQNLIQFSIIYAYLVTLISKGLKPDIIVEHPIHKFVKAVSNHTLSLEDSISIIINCKSEDWTSILSQKNALQFDKQYISYNVNNTIILTNLPSAKTNEIIINPDYEKTTDYYFLDIIAKIWIRGGAIDWDKLYDRTPKRLPLPLYPFTRTKIWPFGNFCKHKSKPRENDIQSNSFITSYSNRSELSTKYQEASTLTEKVLTSIIEELLTIKPIGIMDDFFELGGHSLLVTQFRSKVKEIYQIEVDLESVFCSPNIKSVYELLLSACGDKKYLEEISEIYIDYLNNLVLTN